jgi:sec-independent protein translocase protein TatB
MFDIAPTELLVCAVIALVVIGPKDLPNALRFVGRWVGKARRMAGTFRTGIDSMMREAELKEMEEKWRSHNEAIMKAHPQINMDYPSIDMGQPATSAPAALTVSPAAAAPVVVPGATPSTPVTPIAEP